MAASLSWFKLVLSWSWAGLSWSCAWLIWSCAGPKQLAPAQDQLKPAAMLQNIPNQHMLYFSTGVTSKLHMEVVWNAIPNRFKYRCISVWTLWMLISDFELSLALLLKRHTKNENERSIHTVFKKCQSWLWVQQGTSGAEFFCCVKEEFHRGSRGRLFREWDDAPPFFLHVFWKPYQKCGYAYIVTKAMVVCR